MLHMLVHLDTGSSSKVKVIGYHGDGRKNVAKVVLVTSSDSFLV